MNIEVATFTVSEKSINIGAHRIANRIEKVERLNKLKSGTHIEALG